MADSVTQKDPLSTGKRMVRGSIARTGVSVLTMVVGFLMMPFLVHELGTVWYGIWATVTGIVATYYLLDFGFASAVMRYIADALARDDAERANAVVNTSLVVYLVLGGILLAVTGVLTWLVPVVVDSEADVVTVRTILALTGANLAISFPFKCFAGIVQARVRQDLMAYVTGVVTVAQAVGNVFALKAGWCVPLRRPLQSRPRPERATSTLR